MINRSLLSDTRIQMAGVLLLVWMVGLWEMRDIQFIVFPLLTILCTIFFDLVCTKLKKQTIRFPSSALVTGFILGLVLQPFEYPLTAVLAPLVAVLSKQFLRIKGKHIFNPATLGIVLVNILFGTSIGWWAASSNFLIIWIAAIGGGYILWRLKRLWLPVGFLIAYTLYLLFIGKTDSLFNLVVDGTVFFFAFIMLPEPMTSPNRGWGRFLWGPMVVGSTLLFQLAKISVGDSFLFPLLTANLIWWGVRSGIIVLPNKQ